MTQSVHNAIQSAGNGLTDPREHQEIVVEIGEISTPPRSPCALKNALRLLARWLLAAARKGAPVAHTSPVEGSRNRLDVARDPKVGSDGR